MSDCLEIKNISKSFGKNNVFNNLSFSISNGRVIGLLGENGIGKTTLLRIIAGLENTDDGNIYINGDKISYKTREKISFLIEPFNLYPWMRIKDAIAYYSDFFKSFDVSKANQLCNQFNLDLSLQIKYLSKGNKERVCLMLNLSRKVPLYLLDEPVAGLDPKIKKDIIQTILSNIQDDSIIIIATHLLRDLQTIFDDIIILKKNEVVLFSAEEIREKYNKSVEEYYLEVINND